MKKIAAANAELIKRIQENEAEAQGLLIAELQQETKADFAADAVFQTSKRIQFTTDVPPAYIKKSVQDAKDAGFLKGFSDTSKLVESF